MPDLRDLGCFSTGGGGGSFKIGAGLVLVLVLVLVLGWVGAPAVVRSREVKSNAAVGIAFGAPCGGLS
ncbi:hypothetical protein [Actinoplanes flavus]|uniref:Uncharacterized protein n=1 Tax=Actinoplanes flavus TaxID=2820290 RepID=A0ABS3UR83_9ACTN|nr:hypothetical protein [Actinoplanes flavus]MBO3741295.1 hypothetical protein [Actinoplanes flavus]